MGTRLCSNWVEIFIEYVKEVESSHQYKLYTGIGLLGAAIRKNIHIALPGELIYLNPAIILVGPSGNRKGSVLGVGLALLKKAKVISIVEDAATMPALLHELAKLTYKNGTGVEHQQAHALIWAEELTTLFTKSSLKEGMTSQFMCKLLDSRDEAQYKTRSGGSLVLKDPFIQLVAGSTPTGIVETFTNLSWKGGLAARLLLVSAGTYTKNPEPEQLDSRLAENLMLDLKYISSLSGEMSLNFKARNYYNDWYQSLEQQDDDTAVAGFINRGGVTVQRLAGLFSISENDSLEIRLQDIKEAIIAFEVLTNNLEALAMESSNVQFAADLTRVYRIIKKHWLKETEAMSRTKLMLAVGKYMDKNRLDEAIAYLESIRSVTCHQVGTNNQDGSVSYGKVIYQFTSEVPFLENRGLISSYVLNREQKILQGDRHEE